MKRVEFRVGDDLLQGRLFTPPGRQAAMLPLVLMPHGLASSQVEWYDFPEKVAAGGYAAFTFDFRGHGESTGDRGFLTRNRTLADMKAAIGAASNEYKVDTTRIALLGHSLGAALAIHAASRIPNVRALIAMAPPARLRYEMKTFEYLGYNLMRVVNLPFRLAGTSLKVPYKVDYKRLYESPAAIERARRDDFLQSWLPVKDYAPLVRDLDAVADARGVKVPTLVMVAERDQVVSSASSRLVYGSLAGPKKLVEVPRSGHSMAGDDRSDFVAAQVSEFLQAHVKGVLAA